MSQDKKQNIQIKDMSFKHVSSENTPLKNALGRNNEEQSIEGIARDDVCSQVGSFDGFEAYFNKALEMIVKDVERYFFHFLSRLQRA